MLGEHIQTTLRRIGPFDQPLSGKLCCHAAENTFSRCSGKKIHNTCPSGIVPGPSQTLHGSRDGAGTADLQYLIDFAHINPKFHGGGCTQKPEPAFAQCLFCLCPLLFG